MASTSNSSDSACFLHDSGIWVRSPHSGPDSSYFLRCSILKTGKPGYLLLIRRQKTLGLIFCVISKGTIQCCFSLTPFPLESIQSRECGFTSTLSPFLKSGTGLRPLLYWDACSSCAFAIAHLALSLCMLRTSKKFFASGIKE